MRLSVRLAAPQQEALHLAARRLGQLLDELDLARIGMQPKARSNMLAQLGLELRGSGKAGTQNDERLDDLGPLGIRLLLARQLVRFL